MTHNELPALRQDIQLLSSTPDEQGQPRWMLFDPIKNTYFQLSHHALPIVQHWRAGIDAVQLIDLLPNAEDYDERDIQGFIQFLVQNNLIQHNDAQSVQLLKEQYHKRQHHWFNWLIHNYLFIKLPIIRPNDLLNWLFPKLRFLFHPNTRNMIISLGVVGIILTLHQWDSFVTSFLHFFTWQGLLLYAITLVGVKVLHEFGHALVARKHHCRVGSMGVAFLVLFPVLYTDTTDAWRLKSKSQKLDIVTAGIRVEIYIALLATFLWNFLPEGSLKSAAFFVATTSWVSSLLINISPFLRFDGYYAFSDWLGVENLQQRSFAFAKWHLRKVLFGVDTGIPEPLTKQQQNAFVIYAYATWLYRFFLFLGIALLVYTFAFKALGIFLFLIEIIYFILLPIGKEIMVWWQMKKALTFNKNTMVSLATLLFMVLALFTPWQQSLSLPAILIPIDAHHLYAKEPATVAEVHVRVGDSVFQGQRLVSLTSSRLEHEVFVSQQKRDLLHAKLTRIASTKEERDNQQWLESALAREEQHLVNLKNQQDQLHITALVDGIVVDMLPLNAGQSVNSQTKLMQIVNPRDYQLTAYLPAEQSGSLNTGSTGRFVATNGEILPQLFTLKYQSNNAISELVYPELSNDYNGGIDTRLDRQTQKYIPTSAHYVLNLVTSDPFEQQPLRWTGVLVIEGQPISYAQRLWLTIVSVLIRESGF